MNNNKYLIPSLIAIGIIMVVIGSTFAYWNWSSTNAQKTNITFTTGANFSCSADGGGNITNTNYFVPTDCTNSTYAIKRTITTSITNSGSNPVYLDMWLNINSIGSGLSNSNNFKYALTTSSSSCTTGVVSQGNFNGKVANDKIQLLDDVSSAGTYYLYVWLDAAETSQSTMNQSVSLSLGGECTDQEPLPKLINTISENAVIDNISSVYVTNANGVQFNDISSDTNGKGLYLRAGTENDEHPIYYYRGAVTDNNVLFGGFCWKIVRTTDTGGIKLIYNGVPSNGECNNTGEFSQLASTTEFNTNYISPADVGYMYGTRYTFTSRTGTGWYYAPDVTYNNGTYTLTSKTISGTAYNVETKSTIDGTNLNYHHYTCGNSIDTTCTSVRYVYYVSGTNAYYITLSNGKKVEDALSEMLTNSSNENSSTIKTAIDTWYQTNMTGYTSMLEDTPFCNDRTIGTLNGWDPNGGSATDYLYFSPRNRAYTTYTPSLTCTKNDSFTVSETSTGNGKLTYPVGLLTSDEVMLAGGKGGTGNSTYYLYTGQQSFWLGSASIWYYSGASGVGVLSAGNLFNNYVYYEFGVRPSISLKPGTQVSGGDGTTNSPYVVE